MRIALGIEYEGSNYYGWQSQHGLPTIQDCLEQALTKVANQPIITFCAGRTDAGVHATGQVVHFDTDASRSDYIWMSGANHYLPATIRVRWARQVAGDFHARHSALTRRYHYLIYNHPQPPLWQRQRALWYYLPLNANHMADAAHSLLGEHDFSSFRSASCQSKSPRRNLMELSVIRQGDYVLVDIKADSFLQHMVRNIVGVLLPVGSDKKPVEWPQTVLQARQRTVGGPTVAPQGLYLIAVEYPPSHAIPPPALNPLVEFVKTPQPVPEFVKTVDSG